MKTATLRLLALLLVSAVGWPVTPSAAATRGVKTTIPTTTGGGVRYPDVAYDPAANVFLAVTGKAHAQGAWLTPAGVQLGAAFNLTSSAAYQQAPRANCGESGNCLVVWHEGDNGTTPMGRIVSYAGGFLTAPFPLGPLGSSWEMGAGIAYSPAANEWLVTWMSDYHKGDNISFTRVSLAGQVLATVKVTTGTSYEREPNVVYNPTSNEFVISYAGTYYVNGIEVAYVAAQRVKDGALLGSRMILDTAKGTFISAGEYNPATGSVIIGWNRGGTVIYGRTISATGVLGAIAPLSSSAGSYDALDFNYNRISESFLLVTHSPTSVEDVGVEITSAGIPSAAFTLTQNGGTGNFNPRVVSSTVSALWLSATANSFKTLIGQYATSTAGIGHCDSCSGGTPPPPPPPPATPDVTSFTPNLPSPQPVGTSTLWTTTVSGGSGVQYKYFLLDLFTNQWTELTPWSPSTNVSWTPSQPGTYMLQVWVKNTGSANQFDDWMNSQQFVVSSSTVTAALLASSPQFPVAAGQPVTWVAASRGGKAPVQYKFLVYDVAGAQWTVARDYGTSNQFTWVPLDPGTYEVQVWVRGAGSSAQYQAWASSGGVTVNPGTDKLLQLRADRKFPVAPNATVTWRMDASRGADPLEYKFWLFSQAANAWTTLSDWSAVREIPVALPAGTYLIQGWIRSAGSAAMYEDWKGSGFFTVASAPVTGVTLVSNLPASVPQGTPIIWSADAAGGSAALQYQFFTYAGGQWTLAQAYGPSRNFVWTPGAGDVGAAQVQVWVRSAGSSASYQAWLGSNLTITP